MNELFDVYSLIIGIAVLLIFVPLAIYVIASMSKQTIKLIECGHEDESVKKYFNSKQKQSCLLNGLFRGVMLVVTIVLVVFSFFCVAFQDTYSDVIALPKVVLTDSMARKNEKNTYLTENGLDNQIQVFDLIFIKKAPAEEQLKLYDVAVYEIDGVQVVHRIVQIRPATATTPSEYIFQGDSISGPDNRIVYYEQIKGVYTGVKVPFIGSFILFMQSTAGYLCALLIVIGLLAAPIVDRRIEKAGEKRFLLLLSMPKKEAKYTISTRKTVCAGAQEFIELVKQGEVPFVTNLLTANEEVQERLNALHKELTSYYGVSGGVTVQGMVYQLNRKNIAKMTIQKNVIYLQVFTPDGDYPPKFFNKQIKTGKDEAKANRLIADFFKAKKVDKANKRTSVNLVEKFKNIALA